ncbi:MAG: nucleotidyltransferase domain-containing protein [Spirochaetales bacterium]|nr:nucleotidyltransferase domain-containing protein [Spirochaetales bacterium]
MRLSEEERNIIKSTLYQSLGKNMDIYLFGSRVDDSRKGGDIDLFVKAGKLISLKDKLKVLTLLEMRGIERKVDLIIENPQNVNSPVVKEAMSKGILL